MTNSWHKARCITGCTASRFLDPVPDPVCPLVTILGPVISGYFPHLVYPTQTLVRIWQSVELEEGWGKVKKYSRNLGFITVFAQESSMKLIIRDNSDEVTEWAAKYVIKRINVSRLEFWDFSIINVLGLQSWSRKTVCSWPPHRRNSPWDVQEAGPGS